MTAHDFAPLAYSRYRHMGMSPADARFLAGPDYTMATTAPTAYAAIDEAPEGFGLVAQRPIAPRAPRRQGSVYQRGTRVCQGCREEKPFTAKHFPKREVSRDGITRRLLSQFCVECTARRENT